MIDKLVSEPAAPLNGSPLPKQIHRQVENNQKELNFAATTKPLLKF